MQANTFGKAFSIHSYGESHGPAIGVTIDGCPPLIPISLEEIQADLDRRRPGKSQLSSPRQEFDKVEILSGVFQGKSTGHPIALLIRNKDQKSSDYDHMKNLYRPSHADFTYEKKFGIRDYRGGGRASARETAARVAAGAIARLILKRKGVIITAYVSQIGRLMSENAPQFAFIEENALRLADPALWPKARKLLLETKESGDSLGGIITCEVANCPIGLGEPVFDKLEADLAKGMLSIPAAKGFDIGAGFDAAAMTGKEHNDPFTLKNDKIGTLTNFSGGIQGGISNGEIIKFRTAFKPVATISQAQDTVNKAGEKVQLSAKGRHDPCVLPRAVPIVEAMCALVLCDHLLRQKMMVNPL